MKRQRKKYESPLKPWDKNRIQSDNELIKKFGITKKREIWRAEGIVRKFRRMAREIAVTHDKKKEAVLVNKTIRLGLLGENATLDDVLGLTIENLLERRLQTILKNKGLTNTVKQARQMITHGHVKISDRKVTYPSYIVPRSEESLIKVSVKIERKKLPTAEGLPKPEEVKEGELKNA